MTQARRERTAVQRDMFEVRMHGRGGQGVVTAAEVLSVAAFDDGLEAQAFPSFGSERMGAPVVAYCRTATSPIRNREPIASPDAVIVLDATLLHHVDVFAGLRADGFVLINSARTLDQLGLTELGEQHGPQRVRVVPASDLARQHTGRPVSNICLLGAFAALTGAVTLAGLEHAVRQRLAARLVEGNLAAAHAAYDMLAAAAVSRDA